ncbi:hypothetical protein SEA_IZZY_3 [Streptomyces phage Izzy]|uniref:Uncharacterized protein n=5 Tax=Likavirus izzy TaxID=1982888 RepID=A0A0K1Y930_9CAUD|nr:hypothetical protein AVT27_gp03 [Streptomyces phage Izzy]ATE84956.1 hypothetical protein SEA_BRYANRECYCLES_3 [Streptomyces phage BryanRecycles]ATE85258.1 hypothetical protein SEA_JASH_3 [Streptomyces phage Jash]ATE85333.1 hypothetical protein SEA_OLIYNYK_3 [Streptomyces phage Oliynyk]QDK03934.1 hypothetical protein SEA_RUSTICUS_3 [Streptomyces phage Rusticus]AKY03610.1 hypothetical protein SEA_IZZY_3 [Streptomyces phage Izzy]
MRRDQRWGSARAAPLAPITWRYALSEKYVIGGLDIEFEASVTRSTATDAKAQAVQAALEDLHSVIRPDAYSIGDAEVSVQHITTSVTQVIQ